MTEELQPDNSLSDDMSNMALTTTQPESLGLCYLPVELLDTITAFLDQSSLRFLALTCKATRKSASRVLYATYVNREAPSKAPFHTFLRTLCESPELAAMVKTLDIRGWRSEFETATGLPWAGVTKARAVDRVRPSRTGPLFVSISKTSTKASKPLKLFEETAVKLGLVSPPISSSTPALKKSVRAGSSLSQDEDFVRLLRNDVEDAQVILMLALLPNLTRIRVDGMSTHPTLDWYHFLKRSGSAPRHLRELHIYGNLAVDGRTSHTTSMAFLKLASGLEVLGLSHINLKAPSQLNGILSDKKLRKFAAVESQVDPRMLRTILSGQRLTDVWYKPTLQVVSEGEAAQLAEDRIVDCLNEALDSLRKVALYSTRTSKSPRFAEFNKLEILEMPFQYGFLDGNHGDPQSITTAFRKRISRSLSTLSFRCVHPSMEVPVSMAILADLKLQGEFPGLKTIRLNFCQWSTSPWLPPVPYKDMRPRASKDFGEILSEAGLQLQLAQSD